MAKKRTFKVSLYPAKEIYQPGESIYVKFELKPSLGAFARKPSVTIACDLLEPGSITTKMHRSSNIRVKVKDTGSEALETANFTGSTESADYDVVFTPTTIKVQKAELQFDMPDGPPKDQFYHGDKFRVKIVTSQRADPKVAGEIVGDYLKASKPFRVHSYDTLSIALKDDFGLDDKEGDPTSLKISPEQNDPRFKAGSELQFKVVPFPKANFADEAVTVADAKPPAFGDNEFPVGKATLHLTLDAAAPPRGCKVKLESEAFSRGSYEATFREGELETTRDVDLKSVANERTLTLTPVSRCRAGETTSIRVRGRLPGVSFAEQAVTGGPFNPGDSVSVKLELDYPAPSNLKASIKCPELLSQDKVVNFSRRSSEMTAELQVGQTRNHHQEFRT